MTRQASYYNKQGKGSDLKGAVKVKVLNIGIFISFFALAFMYLLGISDITAKGFILQELRSQSQDLQERHEFYQQQANSLQSFYSLNEKVKTLDMVKVDDIEYIKAVSGVVAKK